MNTRTLRFPALLTTAAVLAGCGGGEDPDPPPELGPDAVSVMRIGGTPGATVVAEGSVWIVDGAGGTVTRVDAATGKRMGSPISLQGGPTSIAAGEDAVWVASGSGAITRIDPATARVAVVAEASPQPGGIAVGDGSVWVSDPARDVVQHFDTQTGEDLGETTVGDLPTDVVLAGDSLWVANTDDGTVSRIATESGEVSDPIEVASQQVLALAAGEDRVWVAATDDERVESVVVGQINAGSGEPADQEATLETGIPVRLATGEGAAFVMLSGPPLGGPGSLAVLDPEDGQVVGESIELGEQPTSIAVGEGSAWVSDAEDGTLSRIEFEG